MVKSAEVLKENCSHFIFSKVHKTIRPARGDTWWIIIIMIIVIIIIIIMIYGNKDETNNYIIECSKLVQKNYKTIYDWLGMVTHWELRKKLKLGHTSKWYKHKSQSSHESERHEILWDFQIKQNS